VRIGAMYALGDRWNVGLDSRLRFDLGESSNATPVKGAAPEAGFDLLAGPMATFAVGPVVLLAQAGVHAMVIDLPGGNEADSVGVAATAGAGACF
jgi:hypothetical protein